MGIKECLLGWFTWDLIRCKCAGKNAREKSNKISAQSCKREKGKNTVKIVKKVQEKIMMYYNYKRYKTFKEKK